MPETSQATPPALPPKTMTAAPRHLVAWVTLAVALLVAIGLLQLPNRLIQHGSYPSLRLSQADLQWQDGTHETVILPHSWRPQTLQEGVRFHLTFQHGALPEGQKYLLIRAVRRAIEVRLNGTTLVQSGPMFWQDARSGYYFMASIPEVALREGVNHIELRQGAESGYFAGTVSAVEIVSPQYLRDALWLSDLLTQQWQSMSFAVLLVLVASLTVLAVLRRGDPISNWLGLLSACTLLGMIARRDELLAYGNQIQFASASLQIASSICTVALTLALGGNTVPRILRYGMVLLPIAVMFIGSIKLVSPQLTIVIAALTSIAFLTGATLYLARKYAAGEGWLYALMSVSFAAGVYCGVHDFLLAMNVLEGPFMLVPYTRMLGQIAVMVTIAWWLGTSLNKLDAANVHLVKTLQEREAELSVLYQRETEATRGQTLSSERERLMQDLHDGLSGHLITIMSLAELPGTDPKFIAQSAREALDDLRLVVHSIDIDEDDLRAALAGFHERLAPRLRRLGVRLNWSSEDLPSVIGFGPGPALAILRILQEAVTNALRHGPAKTISIEMGRSDLGGPRIRVINDGTPNPLPPIAGKGLLGMQRRAEGLGGSVTLKTEPDGGSRFTLDLPTRLSGH